MALEKITPISDRAFVCYTTIEDAAPETVCKRLRQASEIDQARAIHTTGKTGTIEYIVTGESPSVTLLEYGATLHSMVIEQGEATIFGEVASDANTRQIIEGMQAIHSETTFISKQSVDQPTHSTE